MQKSDCFELGYLVKTHGLDGKVQAFFDVEDPGLYAQLDAVFLELNGTLVPYFIQKMYHSEDAKFLIKFEDVDNKDEGLELKGSKIFLPINLLPKLEEGRFYFHDVIGYQVCDKDKGDLGQIKEFVDSGPQTIIVVMKGDIEILIPLHDDFYLGIDNETKIMKVDLPDGLVDLYIAEGTKENE